MRSLVHSIALENRTPSAGALAPESTRRDRTIKARPSRFEQATATLHRSGHRDGSSVHPVEINQTGEIEIGVWRLEREIRNICQVNCPIRIRDAG